VIGVDEDDLEIFVDAVLVYPIRVQNPQISTSSANTLLCNASKSALGFDVVDALAHGLAVCGTCASKIR
jgi:hypothetical protein